MANEPIALLSFLFLGALAVTCAWLGRYALASAAVSFVLLSNLTIQIDVDVFNLESVIGSGISWAIIIYSATYIVLTTLAEKYSFWDPYRVAALCLFAQVVLWLYLWLFIPTDVDAAMFEGVYSNLTSLFATSELVTIAAIAGSVGWFAAIATHQWLKQLSGGKGGWRIGFRVLVATVFGQILNTAIFFAIARPDSADLLALVYSTIAVKWLLAVVSVPLVYFAIMATPAAATVRSAGPDVEPPAAA